jgi:hypothetical protein
LKVLRVGWSAAIAFASFTVLTRELSFGWAMAAMLGIAVLVQVATVWGRTLRRRHTGRAP